MNIEFSDMIKTDYLEHVVKLGFYSSKKRLKCHLDFIYKDINFKEKNVLDIGGGIGIHSFFAACMGAKKVICLDPEYEKSQGRSKEKFDSINTKLRFNNIYFIKETFQRYYPSIIFDIIILHNSINHLNEYACSKLRECNSARDEYERYIRKMFQITKSGSKVIVCDCSSKNFFSILGLKNPFGPSIEWSKHQPPRVWINLFESCNFKKKGLKWSSFNRFGKIGTLFLGNKYFSYFIKSHFCLYMERV